MAKPPRPRADTLRNQESKGWLSARRGTFIAAAGLAGTAMLVWLLIGPERSQTDSERAPGPYPPPLSWKTCDTQREFDCATIEVPLDYAQPTAGTVSLAVIKLPATDPARRLGTVFLNPGGPGGAGTVELPRWKPLFPLRLRQHFDIVSWDPRGIGDSTAVQCFESSSVEATFFGGVAINAYPRGKNESARWLERFNTLMQPCARRNGTLLDHVSTTESAQDLERLRQAIGEPRLNYLGLSYGTLLGATYANLFPDRIRAMVLDGNIDPVNWYARPGLSLSLRINTDQAVAATFEQFIRLCGHASAAHCAFSAGSPEATLEKWEALLRRLDEGAIEIPPGKLPNHTEGLAVTYAVTVAAVSDQLMFTKSPISAGWEGIAALLQTLWDSRNTPPSSKRSASPPATAGRYAGPEQAWAVICAEAPNPRKPGFYAVEASLATFNSGVFGPFWAWSDSACHNWPGRTAHPYTGPWNRPTSAPILVIGNTFDPSTAYVNSVAMTQYLARGHLLTVEGHGHTALLNPSTCANTFMTDYFLTGALPPPGTVCPQDRIPFSGAPDG